MVNSIGLPFGPGSQPVEDDGGKLQYMEMPSGMATFSVPDLPEPESVSGVEAGMEVLDRVLALLQGHKYDGAHNIVDLSGLDQTNLSFVNQVLGEGEVGLISGSDTQGQESVLAGVWRLRTTDDGGRVVQDVIEVGHFPSLLSKSVFAQSQTQMAIPESFGEGVFNAPPLLPEINEHAAKVMNQADLHVINLSLLPHTEQDLVLLDRLLGKGELIVLSRGYGNCRVTSTGTKNVWWVRFYNSQDTLILNTIEITPVPLVIEAAPEDISDSAERLREILEVYR